MEPTRYLFRQTKQEFSERSWLMAKQKFTLTFNEFLIIICVDDRQGLVGAVVGWRISSASQALAGDRASAWHSGKKIAGLAKEAAEGKLPWKPPRRMSVYMFPVLPQLG
ncbi:MAG TPA: hypothetical protein VE175_15050 [Woeseiaceae bacterium]|nr:hypothetical protein [Woeseiaceae bacterium]